jgi:cytochrome c5
MSTHKPTSVHAAAPQASGIRLAALPLPGVAALVLVVVGKVFYDTFPKPPKVDVVTQEKTLAARIQKVGTVELRSAKQGLKTGEEVFKAQCSTCHTDGLLAAPKFGDTSAWAPRIQTGYDALLNSAMKGKNAMGPQGGGDFGALEIGRAVVYMANAAGGKLAEPAAPAPDAAK